MQQPPPYTDLITAYLNIDAPRRWFAEGAIEGSPLVLWCGPEKRGKSWAVQDLGVTAIAGGAWLGHFPLRHQGEVVYLDAEYGDHDFMRRTVMLCNGRGLDPLPVLRGMRHLNSAGISLTSGDPVLRAVKADVKANPPALIVVDPLRNHLPRGGSENDAHVIVEAFQHLSELRELGDCPLVLLHHVNKSGDGSGSRAIQGRADLLVQGSDTETPVYTARGRTMRDADAIAQDFAVVVEWDDPARAARCHWVPPLEVEAAKDRHRAAGKAAAILAALAQGPRRIGVLAEELRMGGTRIKSLLEELQQQGKISSDGECWALIEDPSK